jgi:hypothetical protein
MNTKKIYIYCTLLAILLFGYFYSTLDTTPKEFSQHTKVALRAVGHQLLLADNDSSTVVLPIVELSKYNYLLSFEHEFSFLPNDLVKIVKERFNKAKLPDYYRVSVIQKNDDEVAYSYEISADEEKTIIPCSGRRFIKNKYEIEVQFLDKTTPFVYSQGFLYLFFLLLTLFLYELIKRKNTKPVNLQKSHTNYMLIGSLKFYPEENKLVKEEHEIGLSKKECELLSIFISKPNEIIKRDELIKRVWEDNGVIVGRSLDTFISKLRKKLKVDDTIKLTNVHGVGYKLEI